MLVGTSGKRGRASLTGMSSKSRRWEIQSSSSVDDEPRIQEGYRWNDLLEKFLDIYRSAFSKRTESSATDAAPTPCQTSAYTIALLFGLSGRG